NRRARLLSALSPSLPRPRRVRERRAGRSIEFGDRLATRRPRDPPVAPADASGNRAAASSSRRSVYALRAAGSVSPPRLPRWPTRWRPAWWQSRVGDPCPSVGSLALALNGRRSFVSRVQNSKRRCRASCRHGFPHGKALKEQGTALKYRKFLADLGQ